MGLLHVDDVDPSKENWCQAQQSSSRSSSSSGCCRSRRCCSCRGRVCSEELALVLHVVVVMHREERANE
eukprot:1564622-Amphidinium_carterae.1